MHQLHVSNHPLIAHKMTILRDKNTSSHEFRRVLKEITFYLGYEATRNLKVMNVEINTSQNITEGFKLAESISIIPILRAGTGMSETMLDLLPKASVHHIGMYRSKGTRLPVQYYNRLPKDSASDVAFIVDPCIATAETIRAVCSIVERWGAKKIIVIAIIGAKDGLEKLLALHPNLEIFVAAVDENLSAEGMIFPGIGDAGDRLFGTPSEVFELESNSINADNGNDDHHDSKKRKST